MSEHVSRRKIARAIVARIVADEPLETIMKETAAYLIDEGRQGEYELLVRDIEGILAEHGHVIADVTTTGPVGDVEAAVRKIRPEAKKIHIRSHTDETLIGGIKIEFPGERFDGTVRKKLDRLQTLEA